MSTGNSVNNGVYMPNTNDPQEPPGVMPILCLKRRLWLLPILTSGWLFISFCSSHTAIEAPERCVFGQMVNIGAVMLGMNVILCYLFVKRCLLCKHIQVMSCWYKINLAGLYLGLLSAFGLSMVANFQTEVQRGPHYAGAFLAFVLGTIYCWFQSSLSYKIHYTFSKKWILTTLQLINSIFMVIFLFLFITTKTIFKVQEAAGKGTKWFGLRGVYLTSTITEWLLALSILTFTLTYAPTFRNMHVDGLTVKLDSDYETEHTVINLESIISLEASSVINSKINGVEKHFTRN